jgi:hypothetical protein
MTALSTRATEAESAWEAEVQTAIESHWNYEAAQESVRNALDDLREAVDRYDETRRRASESLADIELPAVELIEPDEQFDEDNLPIGEDAVFDSRASFVEATRKLKDQKIYDDDDDDC